MSKKKWGIAALVGLLIGVIVWSQLHEKPVPVWVSEVHKGAVEATVSNTRAGTIKACRRSKLSMATGGVVDQLFVKEGDKVEAGQLLLELWNLDHKANVQQARHTFKALQHQRQQTCLLAKFNQREAERITKLAAKKLVSEDVVDNRVTQAESQRQACVIAQDQVAVAQAQLALQQAVLERTQLRAPFGGVVAEINGEIGEYVTPSPPGIITPPAVDLIDYSCLYVTAPIDEVDASRVRTGLAARVTLDAFRGVEMNGTVTRIAPYVTDTEKQARTLEIEVTLAPTAADIALLVGYSADISVILEHKNKVLRIPTEALLPGNQIWVVDKETGRLQLRTLKTGIANWTYTEVLEGLEEGEQVVRSPDSAGIAKGVLADPRYD